MTAAADLALILEAAREAGELALKMRDAGLQIAYKAGDSPVTNADLAADALLKRRLGEARPDYGWLSEETADDDRRLSDHRLFVVDPIDGTRAFLGGQPWWVVSVAVVEGDRPSAGVVFAPQLDETYAASAGGGATLNGQPIRVSDTDVLEDCAIVSNARLFSRDGWPTPWPPMRVASRNSTAYRMCLVAGGTFDAALTLIPKHDWDLAAADLIAGEAGAVVCDHLGHPFAYNRPTPRQSSLLCANPRIAPLILDRVRHIPVAQPRP
ncbi:3'(2'),5'-bisphosphate nucleotidase CysQ [Phenylobacterium sp.]|uniref:inositol monophosphatase family protein n=1 Tax=Phenylobacterium sp. TaxID=1871053 RepID=UPI002736B797|nr:3'(2'),5'-bisphosphate nucleotidase CysQ [Phenylobacterium sp.]MDP3659983.1 3'(2'),5'-bisphosphate nucleotidase CysQ [Phenylobacterium sp.]